MIRFAKNPGLRSIEMQAFFVCEKLFQNYRRVPERE